MDFSDNDYFKMGAVVAIGELYDQERLGDKESAAEEVKELLGSFGVRGIQDMRDLGMGDHYLRDFESLYAL